MSDRQPARPLSLSESLEALASAAQWISALDPDSAEVITVNGYEWSPDTNFGVVIDLVLDRQYELYALRLMGGTWQVIVADVPMLVERGIDGGASVVARLRSAEAWAWCQVHAPAVGETFDAVDLPGGAA